MWGSCGMGCGALSVRRAVAAADAEESVSVVDSGGGSQFLPTQRVVVRWSATTCAKMSQALVRAVVLLALVACSVVRVLAVESG